MYTVEPQIATTSHKRRLSSPFRVNIKNIYFGTHKTYITVCSTLVPGPFAFPRHGKGPRNEIDSVLFRSATS